MAKVYVGRLPASLLESDIKELFEPHGAIQSIDLKQGGYAFIHFETNDGALAAVEALNDYPIDGIDIAFLTRTRKEDSR
jgi:RNA recognition motif-containing protein